MNFYNDNDWKVCTWLRELIKTSELPAGTVDERSIHDIEPSDLERFTQVHLFAGIGGWPLALRLAGWPEDRPAWTGSCPCQPFSVAGKGKEESDDRHLWPEFRRLIDQCKPPVIFGEQVASPAGRKWLARIRTDLEALGYAVGAADLCAAGTGAPHIRQRLFWVAYTIVDGRIPRSTVETSRQADVYAGQRCTVDRLADMQDTNGRRESEYGSEAHASSGRCGGAGRLANPDGGESREERSGRVQCSGKHGQQQTNSSAACRMGDSDSPGQRELCRAVTVPSELASPECGGYWSTYRIIRLRDDSYRRVPVEPAFFPLAHGVPERVVRLRGYGNAIVPILAAAFIQAAEEAICEA